MTQSVTLEERIDALERTVARLVTRLDALEASPAGPPAAVEEGTAAAAATAAAASARAERWQGVPALAGRTLLVLGGGFLIRSLTEAGTFSPGIGVTVGVLYALAWLFLADRAAAGGNHLSGAFHALGSALVVYPLIVEATTRFALLPPAASALVLAIATFLGLVVAWRRAFRTVNWITVIAALGTGILLLFRTHALLPWSLYLLALALGSLVIAYGRGWRGQRYLVAVAVDAVALLLGGVRIAIKTPPDWLALEGLLVLQLGLVVVYLGAFILRLLFQERDITPFAVVQTAVVLAVGFEGALLVASGGVRTVIAVGALGCAALIHTVLARRSEQRFGHGVAVAYFSTLATFLAAESLRVLLPATVYPVIWGLAAVVVASLALSGKRPVLQLHGALLAAAAGIASGLLGAAVAALAWHATAAWPTPTATAIIVLVLAAIVAVLLHRGAAREGLAAMAGSLARVTVLVVALFGLGGLLVRLLAGVFANAPGAEAHLGRTAVLRTAILAVAALVLAGWRAAGARSEVARLAAFVLVLGGVKLLAEDLRIGSTGTLVFSLALYGVALILVPALTRRGRDTSPPAPAESGT